MADLSYVVISLAFFAVCVGLIRACDLLIGPDDPDVGADDGAVVEHRDQLAGDLATAGRP
ncbi:MAG: hypothetical protein K1X38_05275 [Microthrixaceae bacterium]|nr:hypothetical protein [Microthrixaceae bacterium]TXI40881.1 MAG: hypothetical protein E6Q57_18155 [Mycobacterium sp.]